jgi:AcrR family transcriptional regulator
MDHREQRKQELRRVILDAARDMVASEGYEAFSMRKLAHGLGYSPGSLYVHFRNKGALLGTLVDESFARLHEALDKVASRADRTDPVILLKEGMRTYVKFGLDHPSDYRIAFLLTTPDARPPYATHPAFEVLREAVARCKKARRFRAVNAELASQALWSAIHGVTSLLIQRPGFPWAPHKTLIRQVIDNAVDSLTMPSPESMGRKSG